MVSLTIDGKDISVAKGSTILDAAAQLGITIPTLCWLKKVSPTGACRVCAVEVEGVDRPMTACNTPVKEGIKVTTQSEKLSRIRQKIMELMLVNHPLDCPVCDAGGECDLQNSCYGLGASRQEYSALLERREIRYNWPLIESDPNRCILCEKCVKVDHEVVGCDAIAVVNRGEATIIDTIDGKPLNCEFCGNCVGACPTGTLISKPFKFRGRPWAFTVTKSVCAFCSTGCQIEYHTRNGRVERVTSDDDNFNSGNLCINGRFGYSYINSSDRLTQPLVRGEKVDWNAAMGTAATGLKEIVANYGPDAVAGFGSPRVTNEESYLFQKLFRNALGSGNIDSEARLGFAQAQKALRERLGLRGASATIDAIDRAGAILVFGCDLNAEATGIEYRVIKAATKNDAKLVLANMRDVKLKKFANSHLKYRPGSELALINALTRVVLDEGLQDNDFASARIANLAELTAALGTVSVADAAAAVGLSEAELRAAARLLGKKKSVAVLFGADLMRSSGADEAVNALANLAIVLGALGKETGGLFPVYEKTNIRGLLDMGVAPDMLPGYAAPAVAGKDLWQIVEGIEQGSVKALYLLGCDPVASFPEGERIRAALGKLELLIVQDPFPGESAKQAHIVLPSSVAAEKSGTFTTIDGRVQSIAKAANPPGEAREDWDILTELCNRLTGESRPASPASIMAEITALVPGYGADVVLPAGFPSAGPVSLAVSKDVRPVQSQQAPLLLAGAILYHSGTTTTWSKNNLEIVPAGYVEIHPDDAARLGVSDGSSLRISAGAVSVNAPARVSGKVQAGLLFAPSHFRAMNVNALLGKGAGVVPVKVEKA
ncbi:molybdopterin oxidoreductase [Geobacter metallireducens RCH3]|uniref:NADPH-Fe(3+) oxidoreductase subunit alpha n=1 Tax=Geobacter metallireducens (strain ATCC 53774 / DSM 7210 / GS-15) TaxID=269799 RepID=Q39R87_GEOMG|nr:NADH-quinone oxidoreductase subunit NuoG [Geobacter metallireducens]ABB33237.1 NADPH oxidoreductase, alpha subunit [Geobacter metallireducens GS-15]EHP84672.1 molybdopterin oxidoreductase [Geobacter metallireducens RCH3]